MLNFKNDQAAGLRRIMAGTKPRIISVLSAHTTETKARLLSNLAASISNHGSNVIVVHASAESSEASRYYDVNHLPSLMEVAEKTATLEQSMKPSDLGFYVAKLLPKYSAQPLLDPLSQPLNQLIQEDLSQQFDIILVDANLNQEHQLPLKTMNQGDILIRVTRNPESIKHAYLIMKQICAQLGRRSFGIVVDGANDAQAALVFRNIAQVAKRFMLIDVEFFGAIPMDEHLSRAAKLGRAVIEAFPFALASVAFKALAQRLDYQKKYPSRAETASFI